MMALLVGVGVIAGPAVAHHGTNISYDRTKQWTKPAVVTDFAYKNPHPQFYVDVKNDKGEVEHWSLEVLPNISGMIQNGWSRARSSEALKPGTTVIVTVAPARAGGPVGVALKITNEQGEEILGGAGGPPPDAGAP